LNHGGEEKTEIHEGAILEGAIAVRAALEADSRAVHVIYIRDDKRDGDLLPLTRLAGQRGIPVERVPADIIARHAGGTSHGGIVARVGERRFVSLDALSDGVERPFVVMLDGVEDPFNFGQAVRAFYAAGAHGLVVRERNWMSAAAVVARSSAGATERIPTAIAESAESAAVFFRDRGLRIAVADSQRAVSIYDADLTAPLFLLVGGEKRGVTRSFADKADLRLKIPYGRNFDYDLGTTAASAALAFEVMRQRSR
jgi:23S rRNA (guanosine2251-2'-O)-methyltransferase